MNHDPKCVAAHAPRLADFFQTRRQFLARCGLGLGAVSLATMLGETFALAAETPGADRASGVPYRPLTPKNPLLPAKAKHVVHLFAQGAPSQVDTWDPKPPLARY